LTTLIWYAVLSIYPLPLLIRGKNGGYINPPPIKRSHRDPYGDWTDKQERRNFGEPVHEDNDILGVFSLDDYSHMSPGRGAVLWAGFIASVLGLGYAVKLTYPDRPSAPTEYPDGLEAELGGPGAVRVSMKCHSLEAGADRYRLLRKAMSYRNVGERKLYI